MLRENLTYKYYRKSGSDRICLVLHGGGRAGVESPFISQLISALADNQSSVLGFNMPYCERGEDQASRNLKEEVAALASVLDFLRRQGYKKITVIGKSLGAIVTSLYLEQNPGADIEVVVLGYVIGDVKTAAIKPKLKLVIQGENDRFGDSDAVRQELGDCQAETVGIEEADHSYRDAAGAPSLQGEAIRLLLERI